MPMIARVQQRQPRYDPHRLSEAAIALRALADEERKEKLAARPPYEDNHRVVRGVRAVLDTTDLTEEEVLAEEEDLLRSALEDEKKAWKYYERLGDSYRRATREQREQWNKYKQNAFNVVVWQTKVNYYSDGSKQEVRYPHKDRLKMIDKFLNRFEIEDPRLHPDEMQAQQNVSGERVLSAQRCRVSPGNSVGGTHSDLPKVKDVIPESCPTQCLLCGNNYGSLRMLESHLVKILINPSHHQGFINMRGAFRCPRKRCPTSFFPFDRRDVSQKYPGLGEQEQQCMAKLSTGSRLHRHLAGRKRHPTVEEQQYINAVEAYNFQRPKEMENRCYYCGDHFKESGYGMSENGRRKQLKPIVPGSLAAHIQKFHPRHKSPKILLLPEGRFDDGTQ